MMTHYWVNAVEACEGEIILAESKEQAYLEFMASCGEPVDCEVYETEECRPEIDLAEVLDFHGENNPEISPLEDPWSTYIGKETMEKMQVILDKLIADNCPAWYAANGEPTVFRFNEVIE